jgi:hypothetical protein
MGIPKIDSAFSETALNGALVFNKYRANKMPSLAVPAQ